MEDKIDIKNNTKLTYEGEPLDDYGRHAARIALALFQSAMDKTNSTTDDTPKSAHTED